MAHVLMLLSNPFRPDPRVHKEARSLIKAGHKVTILCWDREQAFSKKETIDGINILRLGPESSFGSSRDLIKTLPKFWKNLRNQASSMKFDIVHAHDLDTLSAGLKIARKAGVPIIYDSHEIYHEMAGENLGKFMTGRLESYEKKMVKKPDVLLTVNEKLAEIFRGYGAKKVHEIMNCIEDIPVDPELVKKYRASMSPDGKPVALYIGVIEPHRQILELARAHAKNSAPNFILVFGGFGSLEKELEEIAIKSDGQVKFFGRIPSADVPAYNRAADVLFATYDPSFRNNRLGAPNKLFEAMSAGRPLVVSEGTYAGQVVGKVGCGDTASFDGHSALKKISMILDNERQYATYSAAGRKAFEEQYNWNIMEKRLLKIYSGLLK